MSMKWYVVQVYSQYEQRVNQLLLEKIELEGMEEFFEEILIPTEEVSETRAGKKYISKRKFFPGYVLVKMNATNEACHLVKSTSYTSGFVGGDGDIPAPLSDKEIGAIMTRIADGAEKPRPRTLYEVGEEIRIIDGPFNDFNATVEDIDYDKSKLKVSVEFFGRPTSVELEFYQVEKI